jgi:hypothetical protein
MPRMGGRLVSGQTPPARTRIAGLSEPDRESAGGAVAALLLAAFGRPASSGLIEFGRETLGSPCPGRRTGRGHLAAELRCYTKAGLTRLVAGGKSAEAASFGA